MNKKVLFSTLAAMAIVVIILINDNKESEFEKQQNEYATYLEQHPYANRLPLTLEELKEIPKKDRPDLAFEQDFLKTMDPKTKQLPQDRLLKAINYGVEMKRAASARKGTETSINWESRGPKEVSGRVRAMMFDPNDTEGRTVFAGGVSGGIWKNENISDVNSEWSIVYPEMSNFAVSALTYDPVKNNVFYAGTGEGWGNVDAVNGAGIWKTTDAGVSWQNLSATSNYRYVYDMIVREEDGVGIVYAAVRGSDGQGIFRSTDEGVSWAKTNAPNARDLELASDNTIWVGGANGQVYSSADGTTWDVKYTSSLEQLGRVELAIAPSDPNFVYGLISSSNGLGEVIKTTNAGTSWSSSENSSELTEPKDVTDNGIPDEDFTRGQAWYDLIAKVSPSDKNRLFIGGINVFSTRDGGENWVKISNWKGANSDEAYIHADIHGMAFNPANFQEILISTDGGIFYSDESESLPYFGTSASIKPRNLNLNVTQFYSGAIDPVLENGFLGGAQDNGTNVFSQPGISNTSELLGGDGAFSFIDQTAVNENRSLYYIASTQYNSYYLFDFSNSSSPRRISLSSTDNNDASFINPADYDDENNILYSNNSGGSISRAKLNPDFEAQHSNSDFLGTIDNFDVTALQGVNVTHIRVSNYNKEERKIFLGSSVGTLIQLNGANDTSEGRNTPNVTGSISCIELGASDDEILLTYSNYGVKSVWYTADAGANWIDVEGNLPDMPVRWSLFNPLNRKEVLLATEAGIWKTNDVTATNVTWEPAANGMGSVRVDMLQYRASDNLVLAATHGRGMFTTNFTASSASVSEVIGDVKVFTVYPTKSKGNFTVFAKSSLGKTKMNIYDISGRQVYTSSINFRDTEKQEVSINVASGIYFLNLVDENGRKSSNRIIIE
ncbi:T9SS type A sorting domain-containing protein [Polaribacter sp.]|nr:T9SS type A sorting domain-containing protein [Polaribacter sp.]MDC1464792.1 T9SS type A sorting domain-containing protein [Polaribacter sp.]